MTAPTPVSALLHAATLVTAGMFLLLRSGNVLANHFQLNHVIFDSCSHCTDQWTNSSVSIGYQEISGIFYNESARIYLSRLWTRQLFSGCLPPVHTCFLFNGLASDAYQESLIDLSNIGKGQSCQLADHFEKCFLSVAE